MLRVLYRRRRIDCGEAAPPACFGAIEPHPADAKLAPVVLGVRITAADHYVGTKSLHHHRRRRAPIELVERRLRPTLPQLVAHALGLGLGVFLYLLAFLFAGSLDEYLPLLVAGWRDYVRVEDGERTGLFQKDGRWIEGELREADPQFCGWVAGDRHARRGMEDQYDD